MHHQALSSHQKLRSKLGQQQTAGEISIPALPRKAKMKKSGRPHEFVRGGLQSAKD